MYIEIQFQPLVEIEFFGDGMVRGEGLSAEDVETNCAAEGVAYETYAAGEGRIAGKEEVVYAIHFAGYGVDDAFAELWCIV